MIEKSAGLGTAQTTIFGSAFTGCRPLSTRDRTVKSLRQSCAASIVRRAANVDPYTAQALAPDQANRSSNSKVFSLLRLFCLGSKGGLRAARAQNSLIIIVMQFLHESPL